MRTPEPEARSFVYVKSFNHSGKEDFALAKSREDRYIRFYTEGTAAYKMEVEQPKVKASLPKPKKRTVYVFPVDPVAIGAVALCIVMLVLMLNSVALLDAERAKLQEMTDYLYELESENVVLEAQYESQIDLEAVEQRALALGMIPIEEARHITIQIQPQQEQIQEEEPSFWESICTYFKGLFA